MTGLGKVFRNIIIALSILSCLEQCFISTLASGDIELCEKEADTQELEQEEWIKHFETNLLFERLVTCETVPTQSINHIPFLLQKGHLPEIPVPPPELV